MLCLICTNLSHQVPVEVNSGGTAPARTPGDVCSFFNIRMERRLLVSLKTSKDLIVIFILFNIFFFCKMEIAPNFLSNVDVNAMRV